MLTGTSRRLLISQDRDEIYLTLAKYPSEYPAYLQGKLSPSRKDALPFLTMQEYGPWVIESKSNMRHFSTVIMSYCLQFTDQMNKFRASNASSSQGESFSSKGKGVGSSSQGAPSSSKGKGKEKGF